MTPIGGKPPTRPWGGLVPGGLPAPEPGAVQESAEPEAADDDTILGYEKRSVVAAGVLLLALLAARRYM